MDLNGFDRGLEAEKVITIVDQAEKTFISVQFKGQPCPELIPVDVAHRKISGMLIEFYAAHLRYESSDQDEEVEVMVKKKRKSQPRGKGKAKPDTRKNNMGEQN